MSYSDDSKLGKSFLLLIIIFVAIFGIRACATSVAQGNTHTETVTICGKDVVNRGESGHEYRVYTSGSTYVVKDFFGSEGSRFNSADTYGKLQIGKTYVIKSYGYRIPWSSSFWNLTEATPTTQKPTGTCG